MANINIALVIVATLLVVLGHSTRNIDDAKLYFVKAGASLDLHDGLVKIELAGLAETLPQSRQYGPHPIPGFLEKLHDHYLFEYAARVGNNEERGREWVKLRFPRGGEHRSARLGSNISKEDIEWIEGDHS